MTALPAPRFDSMRADVATPRRLHDVELRRDERGNTYWSVALRGASALRHPFVNRGAAFTLEERKALGLVGLLPPHVTSLEEQLERAYRSFQLEVTALGRNQFLRTLQDRNETLFFALLDRHLEELLPVVYTPTVGEAVTEFDRIHQEPRGIVLTLDDIDRIDAILEAWAWDDVRVIVATDSSAILGIGDRGHGGIGISIGKLALYGAAGVDPATTLPVVLDVGTDRDELREDPLYLGVRAKRARGEAYDALTDAFAHAVSRRFPNAILQWEDFAKNTAFSVLERNRDTLASFNDDIQGTGAVTLAGLVAGCARKNEKLRDQVVVIHGAGAGGAGVANMIRAGMMREGLSDEEARARVFVLDSQGLLTDGAAMEDYKVGLAQRRETIAHWRISDERPTLFETVREARATVLIGLSGRPGAFDEMLIRRVAENTRHPIVFALSNPISVVEAHPHNVIMWTEGQAIVATGSPFPPVCFGGREFVVGQGNNAFIFPGLGLGTILSRATRITDEMVLETAYALADFVLARYPNESVIYPPVGALREVSAHVAARVMRRADAEGVGRLPASDDLVQYVRDHSWTPRYLPVRAR